ncbi:toxin-antitoxin system YwqK family antitoxin [Cellulophaga lytica]|uniref:hypothetical protein n=1 Tax=Cellulophaga lytica TaxID=979 RepID=UPI000AB5A1D4|nr:hypothetical protein [Cellulophaga lytica]
MYLRLLLISIALFISANNTDSKEYSKQYYASGVLKAEGWLKNGSKNGFWKFYNENKTLAKQGHYTNNKKENY